MQRRIDNTRRGSVWIERIVWNMAAAAALAVMIVVLLYSLEWLDEIDTQARDDRATLEPSAGLEEDREIEVQPTRVARLARPSDE